MKVDREQLQVQCSLLGMALEAGHGVWSKQHHAEDVQATGCIIKVRSWLHFTVDGCLARQRHANGPAHPVRAPTAVRMKGASMAASISDAAASSPSLQSISVTAAAISSIADPDNRTRPCAATAAAGYIALQDSIGDVSNSDRKARIA